MGQTLAFPAAGTKLSISATAPETFDAIGFWFLSYTEIKEIISFGEIGRVYKEAEHKPVSSGQTFRPKGSRDDGALQLTMAKVRSDPGQIILREALLSQVDYYFRLEFGDNVDNELISNTIIYFPGKVISMPKSIREINNIVTKTVNISVNGSLVESDASTYLFDETELLDTLELI